MLCSSDKCGPISKIRRHLLTESIFLIYLVSARTLFTTASANYDPQFQYPIMLRKSQYSTDARPGDHTFSSAKNNENNPARNDEYSTTERNDIILFTMRILSLIGIYYNVWITYYQSRNDVTLAEEERVARLAALQSILKITTYNEVLAGLKNDPDRDGRENEMRSTAGGGPYYGSLSSLSPCNPIGPENNGYSITCAICLDEYRGDQVVISTERCPHVFHRDCILEWLKNNDTCPCCRVPVITKEDMAVAAAAQRSEGEREVIRTRRLEIVV